MTRRLPVLLFLLLAACPSADGPCKATDDCKKGFACCAGKCTDVQNDKSNCGACGEVCALPNVTPSCRVGKCQLSCVSGFGNCNGVRDDGCELDLVSNVNDCGVCGRTCTAMNATPVCRTALCGAGACEPNFADCDQDSTTGCEIDTRTDDAHCGSCNHLCTLPHATSHCAASVCEVTTCATNFGDCDGQATNGCEGDLTADALNCGRCGLRCGPGQQCVASECRANELIAYGGLLGFTSSGVTGEVHRFDLTTRTWTALTPATPNGAPPFRGRHVAIMDRARNRMLVWCGVDGAGTPVPTDVWALEFATEPPRWSKLTVTGTAPSPRFAAAAALDVAGARLYLFGGTTELGAGLSDLFTFDLTTNAWAEVHGANAMGAPGNRVNSMAAFDPVAKVFLLFGGNDAVFHTDFSELWQFDVTTRQWRSPPLTALSGGPPARARGAFFDGHPVHLFSGISALLSPPVSIAGDFRTLDVGAATPWALLPGMLTFPPPRFSAGATTRNGSLYVYSGGTVTGGMQQTFADLWTFDPATSTWTQLSDGTGTVPMARLAPSLVAR